LRKKHETWTFDYYGEDDYGEDELKYMFSSEEDAIMFALKWAGT
jgi:hypothetical protein